MHRIMDVIVSYKMAVITACLPREPGAFLSAPGSMQEPKKKQGVLPMVAPKD